MLYNYKSIHNDTGQITSKSLRRHSKINAPAPSTSQPTSDFFRLSYCEPNHLCASVLSCWGLGRIYTDKRVFTTWEPLRKTEQLAAAGTILLNSCVSVLGWFVWKTGHIEIQVDSLYKALFDCFIMVIAMDLGMYLFHRVAHLPRFYKLVHKFHHRHEATNPISLFVLHPLEVIGFGSMMIVFLVIYPTSFLGLLLYLTLNIVFGTLGHCGVEPFPSWLKQVPLLKYIGTSTFHAGHHDQPHHNFGFYTLIWDKLFGTLDPKYYHKFTRTHDHDEQTSGA